MPFAGAGRRSGEHSADNNRCTEHQAVRVAAFVHVVAMWAFI